MGTIEEIIQQKKFENDYHRAFVGITYIYNVIDYAQQQIFKKYDITTQQFNVLRILRGQYPKPSTVGLIKDRMIDRNSDTSRIIERLRKSAYVERGTCPNDRRAVDIVITPKGLSLLENMDNVIHTISEPLKTLDTQEINELNAMIDKITTRWDDDL